MPYKQLKSKWRKKMKNFLLIIPFGFILLNGCAKQEEIDLLQRELVEVKKEISDIKEKQRKIEKDLSLLSKRVDNVSKIASSNALELQKLKSFGNSSSEDTENKNNKNINLPLEGEEKVKTPETPEEIYKQGLDAYYKGKIEKARDYFERFINTFKNSELYDNALFWIGQTYYTEGKYEKALEIFNKLIRQCQEGLITDCNKLPTAMLKKAYSLLKLGQEKEAKEVFKQIISHYPETEEAEISRKKLEVIQ